MLKLLFIATALSFGSASFADCVSGTSISTGSYDEICGVTPDGGNCYSGTNVADGSYEEVCGAVPDSRSQRLNLNIKHSDENCCPAGDEPFAGQPCCDGNIADPTC